MQQMNSIVMQDGRVRLQQVAIPQPKRDKCWFAALPVAFVAPTFTLLDTRMRYLMYSTSSVDA